MSLQINLQTRVKSLLILVILRESISDLRAWGERLFLRKNLDSISSLHFNFSEQKSHYLFLKVKRKSKSDRIVVLDNFPVPQWLLVNSNIAHHIAEKTLSVPTVFSFRSPSKKSRAINKAFGLERFMIIRLGLRGWIELCVEYAKLKKFVLSGKKIIEYEISEIPIGLDIYESVLRLGRPTVTTRDWQLYRVSYLALKQYVYFRNLMNQSRVSAVVVSHDNYVGPGLLAHIAFKFNVLVVLANTLSISMPTKPFQNYEKFGRFKLIAQHLDREELQSGKKWAKSELSKRISGEIGIGMPYQIKSAFNQDYLTKQTGEGKTKVLILSHDFFDNPHAYSKLLFDDFWNWLDFLGKLSLETSHEWLIKMHPDYSNAELDCVQEFLDKYPNIQFVDPRTSFQQLKSEGVEFALTCYGSIGHELPLLGYTVVNAGYNPHSSYNFNVHINSLETYRSLILELPRARIEKFDEDEIFEFYYIWNQVMNKDDLLGISQRKLTKLQRINGSTLEFDEYIMECSNDVATKTREIFSEMIHRGLVYSFEMNLPPHMTLQNTVAKTLGQELRSQGKL